ncbi:MAG: ATP-binding protein [Candidatus Omnitrophota bacterium]
MIRKILASINAKSIIGLFLIVFVILMAITFANVRYQSEILQKKELESANTLADIILSAMRYPMLNGDQDIIQRQFDSYRVNLKGVTVAHLLDDQGIIRRSTDTKLIGEKTLAIRIADALVGKEFHGIEKRVRTNGLVYAKTVPIFNEKRCYPCHGSDKEVLGVLRIAMDWERVINDLKSVRNRNILFAVLGLFALNIFTAFFLINTIIKPIKDLKDGMKRASIGDFVHPLVPANRDEIGELTRMFNNMSRDLNLLLSKEKKLAEEEKVRVEHLAEMNLELNMGIEERMRSEAELRAITQRLTDIVEFLPDATFVIDKEKKVIAWNHAMEEMTGIKKADMIGKGDYAYSVPFYGIPRKILIDMVDLPLSQIEKDYKSIEIRKNTLCAETYVPLMRGGKGAYLWGISAMLFDAQGNKAGAIESIRDITERKEIEKSQRLSQVGKLAASMAHEVNNPLMIISGRAQLSLMENIANDAVKSNLMLIFQECLRAKDITQRLLKFSQPSRGVMKPIDLNKSLEEIVVIIEHQFGLDNIAIKRDYAATLPLVRGDEKQLQEVFINLLNNAHEAMEENGTIELRTRVENDFVKMEFRDTGAGMPVEVVSKLFEPFFSTKEMGTGLGISVSYSIIKAHGGQMIFDSAQGKGTTVILLIPIYKGA